MRRAKWKGPVINYQKNSTTNVNQGVKEFKRNSEITLQNVGSSIKIHNGKCFVLINVTTDMIGHKAGEFAPTKERAVFKK